MAVIVVIAIVAILLIYLAGNLRTLHLLSRDLKQIEQKQLLRLKAASPATNAVAVTAVSWPTDFARQNQAFDRKQEPIWR
ncbi:MAG TPA: hypothetical protein VJA21_19290 [Verrucomicrobiae bacterium]